MDTSLLQILKNEVSTDPLALGYAAMTDAEIAERLRLEDRPLWADLSSSQIFESIVPSEFAVLLATAQARVDRILGLGDGIKTGPGSNARAELLDIFGVGSQTIANLVAIAQQTQSRARELGLGRVLTADVTTAKAL